MITAVVTTAEKERSGGAVPLSVRLGTAVCGGIIIVFAALWLAQKPMPVNYQTGRDITTYDFEYKQLLAEVEVEIDAKPFKQRRSGPFYLWTSKTMPTAERKTARIELLLLGLPVEQHPAAQSNSVHLRIGPFFSRSDRNNARQNMVKLGLEVLLSDPTGQ